jgi:hypothetical protein
MPDPHGTRMKMVANPVVCACLAAILLPGAAFAAPASGLQDPSARRNGGQGVSVREIERRVIPRMPGAQYLGFDYDRSTDVYTLKFLRNGSVIWVDVDGRTGAIVRRSGN